MVPRNNLNPHKEAQLKRDRDAAERFEATASVKGMRIASLVHKVHMQTKPAAITHATRAGSPEPSDKKIRRVPMWNERESEMVQDAGIDVVGPTMLADDGVEEYIWAPDMTWGPQATNTFELYPGGDLRRDHWLDFGQFSEDPLFSIGQGPYTDYPRQ
jgi:hypothetical protein